MMAAYVYIAIMRRVPIWTRRIVVWVVWLGRSGPPMVRNAESKFLLVAYPPLCGTQFGETFYTGSVPYHARVVRNRTLKISHLWTEGYGAVWYGASKGAFD